MSASREWYEYHLTPDGWIEGDETYSRGKVAIPDGRVLTICVHEEMSSPYSRLEYRFDTVFASGDEVKIRRLLSKFGRFPSYYIGKLHWPAPGSAGT